MSGSSGTPGASTPPPLTLALQEGMGRAFGLAEHLRHELVTLEHLLLGLLDDPQVVAAIEACGGKIDVLRVQLNGFLESRLGRLPEGMEVQPKPTLGFHRVVERAMLHALSSEQGRVDSGAVLVALLQERENHAAYYLRTQGVTRLALTRHLSHGGAPTVPKPSGPSETDAPRPDDSEEPSVAPDPLEAYAIDLVERAKEGRLDPLVGRESEVERLLHVLCRRRKNNPLLVGEAGVGKTAIAEGLAIRIAEGRVPEPLINAPFFALDLGALLAGTRYRGDFEQRVKAVMEALTARPGALLFIDEIHTLVGAGSVGGGTMDASNLLKPALQRGELRCIGATTFQDAKHAFDRDRGLSRRFQRVEVLEPDEAETLLILKGLKKAYEDHHGVVFTDEALEAAARLASRHLKDLHLPDKAIDVLDEAGAAQRLLPSTKRRKRIGIPEIEAVIAKMARVPVEGVRGGDKDRLAALEPGLKAVVFGQDKAIEQVVANIQLSRAGLRAPEKPIGSFLFAGPTGVGKTELARQMAKILGIQFIRFDMSEFMEKHAVSRLIGAPPGYVGYEEGGILVDAVRKTPHAVLLLDEIEKAHPDLFAILLQVMDHATLTDHHGRPADFRHVILVMTTNAGARDLSSRKVGFADAGSGSARGALEKTFTPEFRNRLDAMLTFAPLGKPEILMVVDKQLDELRQQLVEKKVTLAISEEAREWLAAKGYDPAFGARPMARLIEEQLKRPLAQAMLFGKLGDGGTAKVKVVGKSLVVS